MTDVLAGQALGGSAAHAAAMGLAAAAATTVINSMGEGSLRNLVRRKWGNMPALAATLLLVWDASKPLVAHHPPPPPPPIHPLSCPRTPRQILTGMHSCCWRKYIGHCAVLEFVYLMKICEAMCMDWSLETPNCSSL